MALWAIAAGSAALSGYLSAKSARDDRDAHNKQIAGHQALLRRRITNVKKVHELTTYGKFVDNAAAGAQRIGQALASGGFASNANAMNQIRSLALNVDLALADKATAIQIDNVEQQIKALDTGRAEGNVVMDFLSGFAGEAQRWAGPLLKKYGS